MKGFKVVDIECGDTYGAIVTQDKHVYVWGTCGDVGSNGNSTERFSSPIPIRVTLPGRLDKLFCGVLDMFFVVHRSHHHHHFWVTLMTMCFPHCSHHQQDATIATT